MAAEMKNRDIRKTENRKPFYKRWWFILAVVIIILAMLGSMGEEDTETSIPEKAVATQPETIPTKEPTAVIPTSKPTAVKPVATKKPSATIGQENALKTALQYLDYTAFSYEGLVAQLEYEGYSHADAVWAVDRCGANWNEQAAKKAQDYLDYSSFSRQGLIDQLIYEGFTNAQALYGVDAVGY